MIGVALSQFLWKNHRDMFLFYRRHIGGARGDSYLEIGPGHGLFFMEAVRTGRFDQYYGLDISETSLRMTREFVQHSMGLRNGNVEFILADITKTDFEAGYDFVTMGEVLEHVEQPRELLDSIYRALKPGAKAYLSTCANAPVIDHIYLYNSVDEIRMDIEASGLAIADEVVISIDDIPQEDWVRKKANLSYACIAEKRG